MRREPHKLHVNTEEEREGSSAHIMSAPHGFEGGPGIERFAENVSCNVNLANSGTSMERAMICITNVT